MPRGRGRQERPDRIRGRQLRRPGHRPLRPRWQGARASQRMVRRLTGLQGLRDSRFVMQEEPRAEAVTEAVAQAAVMKTGLAQDGMPAGAEMAAGGPDIAQAEMEAAVPAAMAVETEEAGTEAVAPVAMAAIVTEQVETEIAEPVLAAAETEIVEPALEAVETEEAETEAAEQAMAAAETEAVEPALAEAVTGEAETEAAEQAMAAAETEAVEPALAEAVTEENETEIVDLEQALPEARAALAVPAQARPVPASGIPAPEALTHRFRQSPPTTVRIRTATKMIVTTERM